MIMREKTDAKEGLYMVMSLQNRENKGYKRSIVKRRSHIDDTNSFCRLASDFMILPIVVIQSN